MRLGPGPPPAASARVTGWSRRLPAKGASPGTSPGRVGTRAYTSCVCGVWVVCQGQESEPACTENASVLCFLLQWVVLCPFLHPKKSLFFSLSSRKLTPELEFIRFTEGGGLVEGSLTRLVFASAGPKDAAPIPFMSPPGVYKINS